MIEALRRLGIAARFVSGYIFIPAKESQTMSAEVRPMRGAGLPAKRRVDRVRSHNGILGSRDLIRVAVARDPSQALPLHGTYRGTPDAFREMNVSIEVTSPTTKRD